MILITPHLQLSWISLQGRGSFLPLLRARILYVLEELLYVLLKSFYYLDLQLGSHNNSSCLRVSMQSRE